MRSLGQFARTEELQQMLQEVDVDGKQILVLKNSAILVHFKITRQKQQVAQFNIQSASHLNN
nr:unnamed protein product [Callosobruchus chinensis]